MRLYRLTIGQDWLGNPLPEDQIAEVRLAIEASTVLVALEAPFHGDPAPPTPPGLTDGLWRYEAIELFLASAGLADPEVPYLELELGPHGHFLMLAFEGVRQRRSLLRALRFEPRIEGNRWHARAAFETRYLNRPPWKANAFAVHGASPRAYEVAAPLPGDKPDFHQPNHYPLLADWAVEGFSEGLHPVPP